MLNRDILSSKEIEELLSKNSKQIIDTFLTYYSESSHANMRSSVYRLLYHELSKEEVTKVNFEDYRRIFIDDGKELSTQEYNRQSFFKFLYVFDYLEESDGFESIWIKEREKRQFKKPEEREVKSNEVDLSKMLTIEEIMKIQKVIDVDSTKIETLKMQFCWYAIFELGLDVGELGKNITSNNFKEGKLQTNSGVFKIPEKFSYMFNKLSERDNTYNGFSSLNLLLEELGKIAKLENKLLPRMVKLTRKGFMVTCGNCRNKYTNLSYNWLSVNNRIVCVDCAETIKKN